MEAVEFVRNVPDIDLILMDIRMPVMDGIEATKIIKLIKPELPIIAQSVYTFNDNKDKILSVGFNEYRVKPIEKVDIDEIIDNYLT